MADSESLIEAVEKRSPIYDKSNIDYSNRNYINALWKEIGHEIHCHENEARKKWTRIRDYFQRAHRDMSKTKSGFWATTKKKWYLYDKLTFLIPHVSEKKTANNSNITLDESNSEDVDDTLSHASSTSFSFKRDMDMAEITESESYHESTQASQKRRFPQERKRKQTESELDEESFGTIKNFDSKQDEDELFLRSLVPKMRLMNTYQKLECQAEMSMLILKHIKLSERPAYPETYDTKHNTFISTG